MTKNIETVSVGTSSIAYGASLAAIAVAVVARVLLEPLLADSLPFITLYLAVGFAAWYGGRGPGMLALVASAVAAVFFIIRPRYSFLIDKSEYQVGLVLYGVAGFAIVAMFDSLRNAHRKAEEQRQQLEQEVVSRRVAEQALAEQSERLRTTLASIGDAVITTDMEARITNMNAVAETLTGWTTAEAMGQVLDAVLRLVNQTTRQKVENPALQALKEGATVGLANHTVLIAKDNTERPIDDSVAPIRASSGEVVGSVVVFRDISARQQAQADQREARQQIETTLESVTDGFIRFDRDWRIVYVNAEGERICQLPRSELLGVIIWDIFPALVGTRFEAEFRRAVAERVTVEFENFYEPFDRWYSLKGYPTSDGGLTTFLRDVTDQKIHQEKVRRSEARLQRVFESNVVGMIRWDLDRSLIVEANDTFLKMTGYTHDDVSAGRLNFRDMTPPDWTPRNEEGIRNIRSDGYASPYEKEYFRKDGSRLPLIIAGTRFEDSASEGMSMLIDISESKRAEEALRRSVEQVQTLMDTLPVGVFVAHDPECRSITGNAAAHAMLRTPNANLSKTAPAGEAPTQFRLCRNEVEIPPDQLPVQRAARGEYVRDEEVDQVFEDGTVLHTVVSATPLYDGNGQVRGAVASVQNITERKRTEEALREADRRKDEFLATLAHELRNPLAPIRNGLQVIKLAGAHGNGTVEQARTMMERQLTHMVRLVDDLLDISRVTQGKLELRRERLEMRAVIEAAVETSRPLIEEAGHLLIVAVPDEPIFVDGDATRLAQVVSNLLTNSAKYMHSGGHIRLTVQRDSESVTVSVADEGIGIPPAMLDKVFLMFTQVDRTLEKTTGGLGIGLSLVKGLVEMHGGKIEATSDGEGKGSEFVVRLPVVIEASKSQESSSAVEQPVKSTHRILVVDDNRDGANTLAMMLKFMGNDTRTAYDGQAGVDVAGEFRPNVILLDIGLPKLNGHEACRCIREQPWGKGVVLIAVTGWGQEDDRRRSQEAGFDHHLVKPVDPKALMKMLAGIQVAKH